MAVDLNSVSGFHDSSMLHDHHAIADLIDYVQIVADEEIAECIHLLQIAHQLQDLGLNGYIQSRNRLIQ